MRVLVVNAGSSSYKLRMLDTNDELLASADLPALGEDVGPDAVAEAISAWPAPDAIGHRVVHGGPRFDRPVLIDDDVESELRALVDLAPLHQPMSLAGIDAIREQLPGVPSVACFDTAFHTTIPAAAATYALPKSWRERYGLRRYGFHGLSHGYVARRTGELLGRSDLRLVSCHLGAGASLAAIEAGRSIDTTMGFTPLEGLVMATRSGSVDPGMLLWLLEREELSERELAEALEHESGLVGIAGDPAMEHVLSAARSGVGEAILARDVYVHRLRSLIGSMAASLGRLDALVFTGGVGENQPEVRRRAADGLGLLGIAVDPNRNERVEGDATISPADGSVAVLVVAAREDLEIARGARSAIAGQ